MDEDLTLLPDLGPPLDRIEVLHGEVLKLTCRVDAISESQSRSGTTTPIEGKERKLPWAKTADELEELAEWVDALQEQYAAAGDWLRPCWWRHGLIVGELAALRSAWLGVYDRQETIESSAALDWHEAAEKCRERIRLAFSTGPGCTAVTHKPDQSGTEDPRWEDERATLRVKTGPAYSTTTSGTETEKTETPGK